VSSYRYRLWGGDTTCEADSDIKAGFLKSETLKETMLRYSFE
jgi:hypothetical protein